MKIPASNISFDSKLPNTGMSIFSQMTEWAQQCNAINLSQGFPDFDTDPKLVDLVYKNMKEGFNQYAPMPGNLTLRQRIADKYKFIYNINVDAVNEVTITAGGTQGLFTIFSMLLRPKDEVIIFEPAYDSYRPAIEVMGAKVVPVQLMGPDFNLDWDVVESLINQHTKLIVVNNPNNPTGRILNENDILRLEGIVSKWPVYVLSDEVYEHVVFDNKTHQSVLKFETLRQRSFVVCSFGKLLHTTGWKIGYVIAPPLLTLELRKIHQFSVFSVNTPVQMAIAEYLEDQNYYTTVPLLFEQKRNLLIEGLRETAFNVLPCDGTYFLLLDYKAISELNELEFAKQLTAEAKVAMIPVSAFYSDSRNQNLLRICFAKKDETLMKAIESLRQI